MYSACDLTLLFSMCSSVKSMDIWGHPPNFSASCLYVALQTLVCCDFSTSFITFAPHAAISLFAEDGRGQEKVCWLHLFAVLILCSVSMRNVY